MKLCLITPFNNLKESKEGDMFYALTRQLNENKKYYNWFKLAKEKGFDVIVDNNVHERAEVNFEDHVLLTLDVGTICVVPDVMKNKKKTLEYFHYFMDKFYPILKQNKIKILAVPQGETLTEIDDCLMEMANDNRVDIIGNSFDLTPLHFNDDKYSNQSINRIRIINMFLDRTDKPIHLLGSNGLEELYIFRNNRQIISTDGKLFSRLALGNILIDKKDWKKIMKPKEKMSFSIPFTKEQRKIFIKNVRMFKEILDDKYS